MMQGRKKYQRRQWMRDQEIYFGTKNLMSSVVGDDNRITFRCYTPTGDDVVVTPNYTLNITPYSDMYVSVMFGNGNTVQKRAKGGVSYQIDCPLATMDDTQVTIYGANRIAALNDLSSCYIAANNFSMATKLRKLVLGNTTSGYNNTKLTSLTLGNNALLEELDIRNCGSLTGSINLSNCSNLIKLYAEGTKLTGVTFATNGNVQVAHLPNTINTLIMRNLNKLTDFVATLSQLENLTLEGGTLDSYSIVSNAISTLQTLYLYNIDWTVNDTTVVNKILDLFYSLLTGKLYVSGSIRYSELTNYNNKWSDLVVSYDPDSYVNQFPVTIMNYDGTVLKSIYADQGGLIDETLVPTVEKPSDAQYDYTFTGWTFSDGTDVNFSTYRVSAAVSIYPKYSTTVRSYTVRWFSYGTNVVQTTTANYGASVSYTGDTPTRVDGEANYIYYLFDGWDKHTGFITGDLDVYAKWATQNGVPDATIATEDLSAVQVYALVKSGKFEDRFGDGTASPIREITVQFGCLPTFSNVETVDIISSETHLDGTSYIDTNVKAFENMTDSWTLYVDFAFDNYSTNNMTLLSCYDVDGETGFELFTSSSSVMARVNTNTSIRASYAQYRGVIVLRHTAGESFIRTYVMDSGASDNMSTGVTFTSATSSNAIRNIDTTMVLGARRNNIDGSYDRYAAGTIYKCRLYKADLGDDMCKKMAMWQCDEYRFQYYGAKKYIKDNNGSTSGYSAGSFVMKGLFEKNYYMNSTSTNAGGWDSSMMRTLLNNKVLNGIDQKWVDVIQSVRVKATEGSQSSTITTSVDKIYLLCTAEVGGSTSSPYTSEITSGDYNDRVPWLTSNKARIKWRKEEVDMTTATVYSASTDPTQTDTVLEGDVWIRTNDSSNGYVLVKQNVDNPKGDTMLTSNLSGYIWKRAAWYWLRSPSVSYSTFFWDVNTYGSVNSYYANYSNGVCVAFSI